jgi:PST family polysaccharide transporter
VNREVIEGTRIGDDAGVAAAAIALRIIAPPPGELLQDAEASQSHIPTTGALPKKMGSLLATSDGPADETPLARPTLFAGDTIAQSVIALVAMAVVQRAIGFGRSVFVCGRLEPDQLGEWDLANRFFVLAAPLAVLGLPGSFGRYLEHYRQRGALRAVLLRTTFVCALLAVATMVMLVSAPQLVAEQVFGRADRSSNIALLAFGLVAVIAYNYLTEVLTALRLVRVSSLVQFLNTVAFALLCVALLEVWQGDAFAIVAAYAGSCLLLVLAAGVWLATRLPRLTTHDRDSISHREMWSRLAPFAVWVWVTNVLYNLFEVVDRYMLVHIGGLSDAQALVGQYHSAQVIPVLMVSVAGLLAGMILPHLSRDWESGRHGQVADMLNLAIKLLGLSMFAGSTLVLLAAPLLFDAVWQGKYSEGFALLPLALASCSWLGLLTVAQMYLWCAERAVLGCLCLAIGLCTNVALNLVLIPAFGLFGAVAATTASNCLVLVLVLLLDRGLGMQIQRGTVAVALLPAALVGGPPLALAFLAATVFAIATGRLLSNVERKRLRDVWQQSRARFAGRHRQGQHAQDRRRGCEPDCL